jgi:hypothetical protein
MPRYVNECFFRAATAGLANFTAAAAIQGFYTPVQCTTPPIVDGGTYHYRAESDDRLQHESGSGVYSGGILTRATIFQSSNGGAKVNFSLPPRVAITALAENSEPAGAGYTHTQGSAASTWTVNHNLGFRPDVTIYSAGGREVEADVLHLNNNQTEIYFAAPFSGTARCE